MDRLEPREALLCVGYATSDGDRRKSGIELHALKRRSHHQKPVIRIELLDVALE